MKNVIEYIMRNVTKYYCRGYKNCTFLFTLGDEKVDNERQNVKVVKKRELVEIMWMDDARYRVFSLLQKHGMKIKEEFRIKRKERKDPYSKKKDQQYVWYGPSRGVTCAWDSSKERVRLAR